MLIFVIVVFVIVGIVCKIMLWDMGYRVIDDFDRRVDISRFFLVFWGGFLFK